MCDLELEHWRTFGAQLKIAAEILKTRLSVVRAGQVSHNPKHQVPPGTGSFMASGSATPQTLGGSLVQGLKRMLYSLTNGDKKMYSSL